MKTTRTFALTLICVGWLAGPAFAMSKAASHGHSHGSAPVEENLQDILDGLVISGPPINASSPSPFELFEAGSSGITAQVISASDDLFFGIYDGSDPTNRGVLLKGSMPSSFVSTVSFSDDGRITFPKVQYGHGWGHWKHGKWSRGREKFESLSGFDGPFGFFVKSGKGSGAVYIFTQDALNSGGAQGALVFQGNGETTIKLPGLKAGLFRPDQFILAFDADGDGNFGDMVVLVSGIDRGVPEPASALLIGVSLLALIRMRRS